MSEPTSSSEPATAPVASAAPPPTEPHAAPPAYAEPPRRNRLSTVAAWVGIVAGVVFIVAVVFFTGFFLGAHSAGGGHRGWHHGGRDFAIMHQGPGMFPRSPGGEFGRTGPGMQPPFGPGGPNFGPQQPSSPTTAAPRP